MDKLDEVFWLQQKFDERLARERGLNYDDTAEWVQRGALAIVAELGEMLDATGSWKWWKNPKPIDRENLKEELVDILHFFVSLCLKAGITADELFTAYAAKNVENHARQDGRSRQGYEVGSMLEEGIA